MQSSGEITPQTSKTSEFRNNLASIAANGAGVVTGSGGQKIDYRGMIRENFLRTEIKQGHFDGINKLFKQEELPDSGKATGEASQVKGTPGIIGKTIAVGRLN